MKSSLLYALQGCDLRHSSDFLEVLCEIQSAPTSWRFCVKSSLLYALQGCDLRQFSNFLEVLCEIQSALRAPRV